MLDKELIKSAANKYGFNLEFKTKNIFEKNGFITQHNNLIKLNDELLEIDLIANSNKYPDRPFIIECKGTDSSSALILVKESTAHESLNHMRRHVINGTNFRLMGYKSQGFCTFTGDFFNNSGKELKKASRNDDENNFYKAQLQITDAISAFSQSESSGVSHIIPVIVTNASIWIVDYNNPENTEITEFRYLLHKVKLANNLKLEPQDEESEVLSYVISVVNINYLEEFIDGTKNINSSTEQLVINSMPV